MVSNPVGIEFIAEGQGTAQHLRGHDVLSFQISENTL